jgi:hypothetical protein
MVSRSTKKSLGLGGLVATLVLLYYHGGAGTGGHQCTIHVPVYHNRYFD